MRASTKWGSCCSIPITILLLNLWAGIYPSCFVQQHTLLTPILAGGTWGGTWGSGGGDGFRLRPKHRIKSPDPFCVYSFSTEILILETCNLDHITQESFSIHSSPTWGSFSKPIPMSELKKVGCSAAKKSVPLGHLEWLPLLSVHCQTKVDVFTSYHSLIPLPVSLLLLWVAEMASGLQRPTVAFSQSLSSSVVHDTIGHLFPCETVGWFSTNPSSHVSFISLATFSPLATSCVQWFP